MLETLWLSQGFEQSSGRFPASTQFFFVSRMDQVLEAALETLPQPLPPEPETPEGEKKDGVTVSN